MSDMPTDPPDAPGPSDPTDPPRSDPPPSVGATGLCFMAGALFAHGIVRASAFGEPMPQGGLLLPPLLVVFSLGLLWAVAKTRSRLGVPMTERARLRQRLLVGGAAVAGLGLGAVVAMVQG